MNNDFSGLKNRRDVKWAHPEIRDDWCWAYEGAGAQIEAAKTMSAEEQDNMQNAQCADIRAAYDAAMPQEWKDAGEWKEYFTEHGCPEEPDAPPVRIMVRVPNDAKDGEKLATIFGICGGGMIGGGVPEMILGYTSGLVLATGIKTVIVALQYRLAPAHPYPASLNDCHAAYMWMAEHADELHIDLDKVMMWGNSSGGHLALGLGFRLQKYDFYGNMPRGIMAIMPVLDDAPLTESGKYSFIGESGTPEGWDGSMTIDSAKMWLGDLYGDPYLTPEETLCINLQVLCTKLEFFVMYMCGAAVLI